MALHFRLACVATVVGLSAGAVAGLTSPAPAQVATPQKVAATTATCSVSTAFTKEQFRATWISTVYNIDWPSRTGLSVATQKAELDAKLNRARLGNQNAVVLQVRPMADAFWPSPYEPWSKFLTGTQGRSPGYDPLKYAVNAAHARGLQLHAWFNPYRIGPGKVTSLAANHPARRNPSWVVVYNGAMYYNPGVPAARRFIQTAIMHAVLKYDLDGVHFDDYFYPYPASGKTFDDGTEYRAYRSAGGTLSLANWRRQNVNLFVKEISARIKQAKPRMVFGISPFGIWRNSSTDSRGSRTAGLQGYDDLYADSRLWTMAGWVDYIAPQLYWYQGFSIADYNYLTPWWNVIAAYRRNHVYVGQATYRVGQASGTPWNTNPYELSNHLRKNAAYPNIRGDIYFTEKDVAANRLNAMGILRANWYRKPALTPRMPWIDATPPAAVTGFTARRINTATYPNSVWLTWTNGSADTNKLQVYRIPGRVSITSASDCRLADTRYLISLRRSTTGFSGLVDRSGVRGQTYTYVMVATDRLSNSATPRTSVVTY